MEPTPLAPKSRPPYLLGLLGIIPMIGAFVGVGLLLYGIFRYKDRKLIIIGSLGIVWTIVVYSLLFLSLTKSGVVSNGFRDISSAQINQLVADIELYKLQHGQYPDSLRQLRSISMFAPIEDAVQGSHLRGHGQYNYGRVGDKYYLFSSGPDGIPYTKDDFYPKIDIPDSTKIGLIRAIESGTSNK